MLMLFFSDVVDGGDHVDRQLQLLQLRLHGALSLPRRRHLDFRQGS